MTQCVHVMRSGQRKNQLCQKTVDNGLYCSKHMKKLASGTPNGAGSSGGGTNGTVTPQSFSQLMAEAVIMGDPVLIARETLKTLKISPENYQVLSKKIQYASTLRSGSSEYVKTLNWIKHAMSFPWPRHGVPSSVEVPAINTGTGATISTTNTLDEIGVREPRIHEYIHGVRESLNQRIYGLDQVKEELLAYICKRISNPNATDHVLALQGPNGVGKCLGKDTLIRMADMTTKKVQDIIIGDCLMGDDGTPRQVLSTTSGEDILYEVNYVDFDQKFVCNSAHILCLKNTESGQLLKTTADKFTESTLEDYRGYSGVTCFDKILLPDGMNAYYLGFWYSHFGTTKRSIYNATDNLEMSKSDRKRFINACLADSEVVMEKSRIPMYIMRNHLDIQKRFLDGLFSRFEIGTTHVLRSKSLIDDIAYLCRITKMATVVCRRLNHCSGRYRVYFKPYVEYSRVVVKKLEIGRYYGFMLAGNCMFQLAQGVVTHNTRIAHSLSKSLNVPFRSISLGTVTDVAYLSGHGYTYHESEPGRIVQILTETQNMNTIIYFDELDKIHQTEKGQAVQSFLTHLIDPSQNSRFHDTYLNGLDLDLSRVLFVFSFNNEDLLDRTVKDRLRIIRIAEPSKETKMEITRRFLVPEACANVGVNVTLDAETIEHIVRQHGNTNGLRNIKRVVEDIVCKINVLRLMDPKERSSLTYYRPSLIEMIRVVIASNNQPISNNSCDYQMMYV